MSESLCPAVGWGVLHLFCKLRPGADGEAVEAAVKQARAEDQQVVMFAVLGHKADLGVMALGPDWVRQRSPVLPKLRGAQSTHIMDTLHRSAALVGRKLLIAIDGQAFLQ